MTRQLHGGSNELTVELGNGIASQLSTADRYRKLYGNRADSRN
ncbi:hypothetical protein [Streptomyces sp. KL116D]